MQVKKHMCALLVAVETVSSRQKAMRTMKSFMKDVGMISNIIKNARKACKRKSGSICRRI